jgi:hypothetical protein
LERIKLHIKDILMNDMLETRGSSGTDRKRKMISLKEATMTAMTFVADTFPGSQPRLEEIELSDDGAYWHITVSFYRGPAQSSFAASFGGPSEYRDYKRVTIDANAGNVKSVKIRQLTS